MFTNKILIIILRTEPKNLLNIVILVATHLISSVQYVILLAVRILNICNIFVIVIKTPERLILIQ